MNSVKNNSAKVAISLVLILIGASLAVTMSSTSSYVRNADGLIIDFGDRDITYSALDASEYPDAYSALEYACSSEGFVLDSDGKTVTSIDGFPTASQQSSWGLYVTEKGKTVWTEVTGDPSEILLTDYSAVAWGLCSNGQTPMPAVDSTGVNFYGYGQAKRIVTLAPSVTETVVAIGGLNAIVGTDLYSDYPRALVEAQNKGAIAIVGGYTNPSFELIVKENPDLVVCLASQAAHISIAEKLRARGTNVVVSNEGESIETVYENTYIIGTGMGYELGRDRVIDEMDFAFGTISDILADDFLITYPKVMITLSTVKSPWVSGSSTYLSDILDFVYSTNIYETVNGWQQVNSESILMYNPDYILIVGYEGSPTQDEYQKMLDGLPAEWKRTGAFKNDRIYVFEESAATLASHPAPRVVQITELIARILHPEAFDDGIAVPNYFGDNFKDFLTITKEMDFS
ncbi:MAG: helical backbone metal receptor [Candidatus Methanoplasma sp.]|nr:helical backbone metal receptor [Candidatus Methanoplasma sp.]